MTNQIKAMYVHVPFCKSICYYCDFCHRIYAKEVSEKWLASLQKELKIKQPNKDLNSVYIGGGTPSALAYDELKELLSILEPYTKNAKEVTIEINPETFDAQKAQLLHDFHVNRASVGYQTYQKELLQKMNRHHSYEDVKHTMDLLRSVGITNISLDLMYALPFETMEDVQTSFQMALALKPTHFSIYSLILEEGSVFGKQHLQPIDEDLEADMYEWLIANLEANHYIQYEVSNFALNDAYESMHNLAYWHYDDFYGISLGASGKEQGVRYDNTFSFQEYFKDPCLKKETVLTKEDQMFEMVMMNLRLKKGMSLALFKQRFGVSFEEVYAKEIESLCKKGLLEIDEAYVKASTKGYLILNSVLEEFL